MPAVKRRKTTGAARLRRVATELIERLPPERLTSVVDYLAYLDERESDEATEELLRIPGFVDALREAEADIAAGRLTPVGKLRRRR